MISAFLVFLLLAITTYGFFSFSIASSILKLDTNKILSPPLIVIFSLGLAPFLTTLFLHYLLWLFPGMSSTFYVSLVISLYFIILFFSKNNSKNILKFLRYKLTIIHKTPIEKLGLPVVDNNFFKIYLTQNSINFLNIFVIILTSFAAFNWILAIIGTPITGHDILEYAIQAKHFARERIIEYIPNRYHAENNFFYVGLHGFSFPLLGTWEYLFSEIFGVFDNDYFLRSITGYYSFLIFFLLFTLLKRINLFLAVFSSLILFCTYGFYLVLISYHIDSYRIFMVFSSFVLLAISIQSKNLPLILLLGLFTGAQAYIHSLGVFIALFIGLSFFAFFPSNWKQKLQYSFLLFLVILFAGGIHYVMDVFFGTGWIFQKIKYY